MARLRYVCSLSKICLKTLLKKQIMTVMSVAMVLRNIEAVCMLGQ